jgi:iron complex outermembrane receptor protein
MSRPDRRNARISKRNTPRLAAISVALGSLYSAGAWAQTATTGNDVAKVQDVVVTTGSRGDTKTVADSLAPITVVTDAELAKTGKQNLRDALASLDPTYANVPGFKGQQGIGVNTASLRGLSGNEVLVLVNGKRRHSSAVTIAGIGGTGTDLDLIPVSAIDHIEILKDGAAAQYGSDAIAGVINIILKSDSSGGSLSTSYGQNANANVGGLGQNGKTGDFSLNQGIALPHGGSLNLSAAVITQKDTNVAGPVPNNTNIYPLLPNGSPDPRETTNSRYRQIMGQPNTQTQNFSYNFNLPINDAIQVYSNATYSHRFSQGFGTYRSASSSQNNLALYPEGFLPQFAVQDNDYQVVAGVKGTNLLGWDWDLSTSYGRDDARVEDNNALSPSFGAASATNFYLGSLIASEWTTNLDLTRKVNTGLFDKPLQVSFGFEHRYDEFQQTVGDYQSYAQGGYVPTTGPFAGQPISPGSAGMGGFSPSAAGSYGRTNDAAYIDLAQALTSKWTVDLAGRFEHYDQGIGNVASGKLSTRYEFSPAIAVRGTVSNGFSAPSLQDSYFTNISSSYNRDVFTGAWIQQISKLVPASNPAAQALGATQLKPEKSTSFSVGFVLKPIERLNVSVDAYQIVIENRIVQSTALQGSAVQALLTAAGQSPNQTVSYFANAGTTVTQGVDVIADYFTPLGKYGDVKWTFMSTQQNQQIRSLNNPSVLSANGIQLIGRDAQGRLTVANPKNVTSLSGDWTYGKFGVFVKETRYSSVVGLNAIAANRDEYVPAAFITDLNLSYWLTKKSRLSIGANNLFNKKPPNLPAAAIQYFGFPVSTPNPSWFSPYGVNGGFYYARLDVVW